MVEHSAGQSTDTDEPHAGPTALAWRLLTSTRTLLALSAILALLLVLAAALPERPLPSELAARTSFAAAEAARGLGLDDVLLAWPTLLIVLLVALNGAGILLARRRAAPATAPPRRRGLAREGAALALIGVVALGVGLGVARSSALDARLVIAPELGRLSEAFVRDGDLLLPRTLPYGLMCQRPDPQDPSRRFDCRLASTGAPEPTPITLVPGQASAAGDLVLEPLAERPRTPAEGEAFDLVLTRQGGAAPAIERLRIEPGTTVELRATGQRLTALPGPDGPLVIIEAEGARPTLLAAPGRAASTPTRDVGGLHVDVIAPTELSVAARTTPEAPLVLAGTLLFALGLLLVGLREARA